MTPSSWSASVLSEGIDLISGRHIQAAGCNADGIGMPYLTGPEDFPDGCIRATKFVSKPDVVCGAGDVLLVVKGSGTGKMARADRQYCISRQLMAIRSSIWSTCFLAHYFRAMEERFNSAASGLIPGITRSEILETPIMTPPLPQQRKIARILTTVDNLIEKTEALIAKYQAIKQGMMHDLFTRGVDAHGHLRPPYEEAPELYKQSELGCIPKEWEVVPLRDCTSSLITYGIVQAGPHLDGGIPYIRTGDMAGNRLHREDMLCTSPAIARAFKRSEVHGGEIVCAIRATVGKVLEVPPELDGANLTQGTA